MIDFLENKKNNLFSTSVSKCIFVVFTSSSATLLIVAVTVTVDEVDAKGKCCCSELEALTP